MNKKVYWFIIAVVLFAVFITGCNNPDNTAPSSQNNIEGYRVKNTEPLDMSSDLYAKLIQSGTIQTYQASAQNQFGALDFSNAQISSYEGTEISAIIIPIVNQEKPEIYLLVYYSKEKAIFDAYVWDLSTLFKKSTSKSISGQNALSGSILVYSADATFISGASYEDNKLANIQNGGSTRNYWSCVGWCLNTIWPSLPWYVQDAARGAILACIWSWGNPWPCTAAVSFFGGLAAGCEIGCLFHIF